MSQNQEIKSLSKYVRMSPTKLQQVARVIRGMLVNDALNTLKFIPRKSARLIEKTLKSAVANAENNHNCSSMDLIVESAVIENGPALKRWMPAARGQAHPIRKRTSHIRIVLTKI